MLSYHAQGVWSPEPQKLGVVAHVCDPSTWEVEDKPASAIQSVLRQHKQELTQTGHTTNAQSQGKKRPELLPLNTHQLLHRETERKSIGPLPTYSMAVH